MNIPIGISSSDILKTEKSYGNVLISSIYGEIQLWQRVRNMQASSQIPSYVSMPRRSNFSLKHFFMF